MNPDSQESREQESREQESRESESEIAAVESFVQEVVGRASQGGPTSLDALLPLVYDELRVLAAYLLRGERWARTLRPTALAHEAYLRLARETRSELHGRGHLLAVAAKVMRRVLIDQARARLAGKRGSGAERITLSESLLDAAASPIDLLDLHRALEGLAEQHPRKVQVVELLYFAGLDLDEAAAALDVSSRTVVRDWRYAKAWLWRELNEGESQRFPVPPESLCKNSLCKNS